MYCHEVTWIWNEVRVVAPGVLQPILLEQAALLLRGPDKLGLVAAALGAPGPEDETNEDNHQDQDRDDGQEDPDNWGHLDSLMRKDNTNDEIERILGRGSVSILVYLLRCMLLCQYVTCIPWSSDAGSTSFSPIS